MKINRVFSDFIEGTANCFKLYEDEYTFCFLSNFPDRMYHVLVIPKIEVDSVRELPDPYYSNVWLTVKNMSEALTHVTGAKRIYQYVEGFEIPHAHVHLYPINSAEDIDNTFVSGTQLPTNEMQHMQQELIQVITKKNLT